MLPKGSFAMSTSLPHDRMVCVLRYRCGRDQLIITDVTGQPLPTTAPGSPPPP